MNTIRIVRGGVLDFEVDAIVNAAKASLLGGGAVDGAIHRAAGPKLLEECRTLGGAKTGEAKITAAYNIAYAKHIIHAVGPIYQSGQDNAGLLASCYRNSLNLAYEHDCISVALPCISTGVYGYPIEEASAVAYHEVKAWSQRHPDADMEILFCCYRQEEYDVYMRIADAEQ